MASEIYNDNSKWDTPITHMIRGHKVTFSTADMRPGDGTEESTRTGTYTVSEHDRLLGVLFHTDHWFAHLVNSDLSLGPYDTFLEAADMLVPC